jgi:hypothetical protein
MKNKKYKDFDCVEMKHELQKHIYEATKGMTPEEYKAYIHERITNSQFAWFLKKEEHHKFSKKSLSF